MHADRRQRLARSPHRSDAVARHQSSARLGYIKRLAMAGGCRRNRRRGDAFAAANRLTIPPLIWNNGEVAQHLRKELSRVIRCLKPIVSDMVRPITQE